MRKGGERFNGGEEGCEGGREGRGGKVGGEGILQAVEVVIEYCHFTVEVVGEGLGGGGIAVHGCGDGWGDV